MTEMTMKLLLITYYEAIDMEVTELVESAGAQGYTKWTRVIGKGAASGPHFLTKIWPPGNNVLAVALDDDKARLLMDKIRAMREKVSALGLKAFLLPVEDVT